MAFDDVRLPVDIERGAVGGPRFKTIVNELQSGHEQRNQEWTYALSEWNIGYGIQSVDDLRNVTDFFVVRRGRARGFRFKDWYDFELGDVSAGTGAEIATGDGATVAFQLVKRYTSGGVTYSRNITRPISSTVRMFQDATEIPSAGFTVNDATGIVTFDTTPTDYTPSNGASVLALCEFDVPVRFDQDEIDINLDSFLNGAIPNISIKELRE